VDIIAGSSELFMFEVDTVITKFDFEHHEFTWLKRQSCLAALDNISADMFVDACLLAGSDLLPTLPQLESSPRRNLPKLRSAIDIMTGLGRTGISVCLHYKDDPQNRAMNYLDLYQKNRLAIQHHVVLTKDGRVEPFRVERAPGDVHEFIGQRLPDEIYFYLSKGVLGPTVLEWRTSGEINELPPVDNGESEDYRNFVQEQLTPLRTSALSLLSHSLHHWYQHKDVTLRCFFDRENRGVISMKDLPDPKPLIQSWNVKTELLNEKLEQAEVRINFCLLRQL
jgi:hypothetical protein